MEFALKLYFFLAQRSVCSINIPPIRNMLLLVKMTSYLKDHCIVTYKTQALKRFHLGIPGDSDNENEIIPERKNPFHA